MKAVLVMDMPDGCVNCALCRMENRKGYNDYICVPKNQIAPMAIGTNKPDWCPLREKPGRIDGWSDYGKGWNDAVEAIEGSEEDG